MDATTVVPHPELVEGCACRGAGLSHGPRISEAALACRIASGVTGKVERSSPLHPSPLDESGRPLVGGRPLPSSQTCGSSGPLVERLLERLACFELRHIGRRNGDSLTGARVAPLRGGATRDAEGSEAHQANLSPPLKRLDDAIKNSLNGFRRISLRQPRLSGHDCGKIVLVHLYGPPPTNCPKRKATRCVLPRVHFECTGTFPLRSNQTRRISTRNGHFFAVCGQLCYDCHSGV